MVITKDELAKFISKKQHEYKLYIEHRIRTINNIDKNEKLDEYEFDLACSYDYIKSKYIEKFDQEDLQNHASNVGSLEILNDIKYFFSIW